ncbi:hypothetical protein AYO38_00855 [bacterium SCGC AG-212-C10]|nr:hypothetical protein AYO38_00855 [bacterium SCGC AG-212-C10]
MIVYLVRHGETAYNRDGLGLGVADVPLTEFGMRQARAVGERFRDIELSRILCSPLGRAGSVAAAMAAERVSVELRDELIEMDVGETEGLAFAEMRSRFPDFLKAWAGDNSAHVRMPGGESIADVAQRMGLLLNEIREWNDPAIALVSHNFVLKVAICLLLNIPPDGFRNIGIDLASVTTVSINRGRVMIQSLNDTCHLQHLNVNAGNVTVTS